MDCRLSSGASHVSAVVRQGSDGSVDPKLYVFSLDWRGGDGYRYFNFASGRNDAGQATNTPLHFCFS